MPRIAKKSAGPVHGTALIERYRRVSRNSRQRCRRSESDDGSRKRRRELSMSDVGKKVNKGNTRRAWYFIEEFRRVIAFGSEGDSLNPISFYLPRIFPAWFFDFFFRGEIIINSLKKKKIAYSWYRFIYETEFGINRWLAVRQSQKIFESCR